MTWTRLTVHWIVNDCDLRKVSFYTQSKGCLGLHVVWKGDRGQAVSIRPGS